MSCHLSEGGDCWRWQRKTGRDPEREPARGTVTICDDSSPNEDRIGQAIMGAPAAGKKEGQEYAQSEPIYGLNATGLTTGEEVVHVG